MTAWVFNMITVLVLLTPCLALSNSIFDNYVFGGAKTMRCCAENFGRCSFDVPFTMIFMILISIFALTYFC